MKPEVEQPGRSSLPYGRWLAGIAAGTLLATLLAPNTGWIVRDQLATHFGMRDTAVGGTLVDLGVSPRFQRPEPDTTSRLLREHADDFPVQLAGALDRAVDARRRATPARTFSAGDQIRELTDRFADRPGLYAAALRMDTTGAVRIVRPEKAELSGDHVDNSRVEPPSASARLEIFDRDAAAGERLEPDNAYYPTMRAIGHFAGGRDNQAIADLKRAAARANWDEHLGDEVTGRWRLATLRNGHLPALHALAIGASILFPHYAQIRNATQIATLRAMRLEQAGKAAEGAEIRDALMRIGDLMRSHATSLIGNLVGVADVHIATSRPGGAAPLKRTVAPGSMFDERDGLQEQRLAELESYWSQSGLKSEIPLARARYETGIRVRKMAKRLAATSLFNESSAGTLAQLWTVGAALLANAWWLLLGGTAGWIATQRRTRSVADRMPPSGPFVLGAAALAFIAITANMVANQSVAATVMMKVVFALSGMEGGSRSLQPTEGERAIALFLVGIAAPLVLAVGAALVSVVRRIPLRVGLGRTFSRVGLPAACLLILAYCVVCTVTAQWEERVTGALEQTVNHEGRYLARLSGEDWPGPVE